MESISRTTLDNTWYKLVTVLLIVVLLPLSSFGQEYGLEFIGKSTTKDQRTKLDLNPKKYYSFSGDFELRFSLQLRSFPTGTFGYIVRIIDDTDNTVDMIFDGPDLNSLHVVTDPIRKNIKVSDPMGNIYNDWTDVRLKYNFKEKTLRFQASDTTIVRKDIDLSKKIKFFFGRNDYDPIQTTDVPAMNIKDIRIYQKGKCIHHFPLNEIDGEEAIDILTNKKGIVENPSWIKVKYVNWRESFETSLDGMAVACFDEQEHKIYMAGNKQIKVFSVLADSIETITYTETFTDLIPGSRILYDSIQNSLICYSLKIKTVHYFDFSERKWVGISNEPNRLERFWFHNQHYSHYDSTIYAFGGYSQHRYFNSIERYEFATKKWDTIEKQGEDFHPRMHAAIGHLNDTLYIIGGFGSKAGTQIQKPEHYTDLLAYSLKEQKFVKRMDFEAPMTDIDFAQSMIINEIDRSFYVLATSIFEYNSSLRLLKGNLSEPKLKEHSGAIPYIYHNENSFCDIFYSRISKELFALTTLADVSNNSTKISVNKIAFPPTFSSSLIFKDQGVITKVSKIALLLLVVTGAILFFAFGRRKKKPVKKEVPLQNKLDSEDNINTVDTGLSSKESTIRANSILFFGGFQVINRHGEDITRSFTPLLKELFLLIFLNSIKDKGISVSKLSETLWFSMDAKTAKNNRAVNIAKLKKLLLEIEGCDLSRNTGYWQVLFDDSIVYNDYWSCMKGISSQNSTDNQSIRKFLDRIGKGALLGNVSYEWLDEFKLHCSNILIDKLTEYIEKDDSSDHQLMIELADAILIFDIMHEGAMGLKCIALAKLGKHNQAKEIYAKFSNDYIKMYGEPFHLSLNDVMQGKSQFDDD